jgi:transitional endoplasmic reticulum ATPase
MLLYVRLADGMAGVTYEVHYVDAQGADAGMITEETTVWLVDDDHQHGPADHDHEHGSSSETVVDTTFEDVGGLGAQISEVREFVELPLVFPQVYRQLGINPPRGVIFHGAPGTGKTLLARSVANEIAAQLFYINGPEVVGTFSGETEANLRKIFAEASLAPPAIIFIDEIDALAPARRMAASQSDARAVTQLLALMDGMRTVEGVIVIGTTNRVDAIDPAMRRAGRFDREIHFPSPSREAREQILRVQTREMPLSDDAVAAIPDLAARAYGYVGADLMELSREAGLGALRRAAGAFVASPSVASYPDPRELVVTAEDFDAAMRKVRPSAMRESLIAFPDVTWDDIGGLEAVKTRLRDLVERPLRHPDAFAKVGLSSNLGVLLHGPPGTGKTLLAQAVARESGANFIPIQGPELFSQWLGESEESVRHVFNVATRSAPCVVFFDQLDAVVPRRSDLEHEGTRAPQRVVNQLLAELDGMADRGQVIVIGATNRIEMVDPAALRPGRFGVHLHVGAPEAADRAAILRIHLADTRLAEGLDREDAIERLVGLTEGLVGAQLAFLCQNAKLAALVAHDFEGDPAVGMEHLESACAEMLAS